MGQSAPLPHVKQAEQQTSCLLLFFKAKHCSELFERERKSPTLIQIEAIYFRVLRHISTWIPGRTGGKRRNPHIQKPDLSYCAQRSDCAGTGPRRADPEVPTAQRLPSGLAGVTRALIPTQKQDERWGSASLGQPQTLGYTQWEIPILDLKLGEDVTEVSWTIRELGGVTIRRALPPLSVPCPWAPPEGVSAPPPGTKAEPASKFSLGLRKIFTMKIRNPLIA